MRKCANAKSCESSMGCIPVSASLVDNYHACEWLRRHGLPSLVDHWSWSPGGHKGSIMVRWQYTEWWLEEMRKCTNGGVRTPEWLFGGEPPTMRVAKASWGLFPGGAQAMDFWWSQESWWWGDYTLNDAWRKCINAQMIEYTSEWLFGRYSQHLRVCKASWASYPNGASAMVSWLSWGRHADEMTLDCIMVGGNVHIGISI
jgi:hypothetical protein